MTGRDGILLNDPTPTPGPRDCRFVRDNAAGYSLGALQFEDHLRVESHITSCPMCAKVVAELTRVVEFLPFNTPLVAPSPEAKATLLQRFESHVAERERGTHAPAPERSITLPASTDTAASPPRPSLPAKPKKNSVWRSVAAPLSTIPLVIAIVIVGGWAFSMRADNISKSKQIALMSPGGTGAVARQFKMTPAAGALDKRAGGFILFTSGSRMITVVLSGVNLAASYHIVAESTNGERFQCGQINVDESGNGAVMISLEHPVENIYMIHVQRAPGTNGTLNDSVATQDVFHAVLQDPSD